MKHNGFWLLTCFLSIGLNAQPLLSPESAVQLALKQNLFLAANQVNSLNAELQQTYGNAGFLPSLQINTAYSMQSNDLKQEFSNGLKVDKRGVGSSNLQAGLGLQWTLFDGGRMFHNWNRLKEESRLAGFSFRAESENLVANTLMAYYRIVQLQQQLKSIEAGLKVVEQQVLVSKTRLESGAGSRQEYLQSEIDLNNWKVLLIKQRNLISNSKIQLNELLSRPAATEFQVLDTLPSQIGQTELNEPLPDLSANTALLMAASEKRIASLASNSIRSQWMPSVSLNAGYQFGRTSSEGGFALFNQSGGPVAGLGMSWSLFNGGKLRTSIKSALLAETRSDLVYRSMELSVQAQARTAWLQLNDQREIRKLEEQIMIASAENLELALERFKIGKSDILSLKEAQRSYQESLTRLGDSRLSTLSAEIALLRVQGKLIQ